MEDIMYRSDAIDKLFDKFFSSPAPTTYKSFIEYYDLDGESNRYFKTFEDESGKYVEIIFKMPGFSKEHVTINADKKFNTVRAHGKREGFNSLCTPEVTLPTTYDLSTAKATMEHGLLKVTVYANKESDIVIPIE